MKEEKSQPIPQGYKKIIILWIVICQQMGQPRRNRQISRNIQPSQTETEIDCLNRMITSGNIELLIIILKNLPANKSARPDGFIG